jgi:hypothetical protein
MKDFLSSTDLVIWILLIVAQMILCACSLRRHLVQRLPWFSVYIFVSAVESISLLTIAFFASYTTYYHAFYIAGFMVSITAFLTLVEFGRQVLPGLKLPEREKAVGGLMTVLGIIILFAVLWPLRSLADERRIEVAACLSIAMAFFFVAGYAHYLGLRWSRLLGGVAFTLGALYLVDGSTKAIIGHYPSAFVFRVRQLREVANLVAVVIWTVVILSPWGEYEMTEETVLKARKVLLGVESSLREFVVGSSR